MSLADRMKARKKKRLAQKQVKLERKLITVAEEFKKLDAEMPDVEMPASRFTDEYFEFLKQQEAIRDNTQNTSEES